MADSLSIRIGTDNEIPKPTGEFRRVKLFHRVELELRLCQGSDRTA